MYEHRPGSAAAIFERLQIAYGGTATAGHFDLGGDLALADRVEQGIPTDAVDEAIKSGVVAAELVYDMVLPRRTLAHRKEKEQRLSPEESDRFARLLRVYSRAELTLGDTARAWQWLSKENRALNGRRPVNLLSSDAGTRAVEKVLGRIDHGVFS